MPTIGLDMSKKTPESWLVKETLRLLDSRHHSVTLSSIAAKTNLSAAWISMFAAGKINGASAVKVEAVYNALADKPLGE